MNKLKLLMFALMLVFWTTAARGEEDELDTPKAVIVRVTHGGSGYVETQYDSGTTIALPNINGTVTEIRVFTNTPTFSPTSTDIGRIDLACDSCTATSQVTLFIGSASFPADPTAGANLSACRHFGGVTVGDNTLRQRVKFAGGIAGNLTGSVTVGELYRLDVRGDGWHAHARVSMIETRAQSITHAPSTIPR